MRGGYKSIKNRWLASYEAEQRAAEAAAAAATAAAAASEAAKVAAAHTESVVAKSAPLAVACIVEGTTLPSSGSPVSSPQQIKQEIRTRQRVTSQLKSAKQTQLDDSSVQQTAAKLKHGRALGKPQQPQAGNCASISSKGGPSAASAHAVSQQRRADGSGQENHSKPDCHPDIIPGSKEAAVLSSDSKTRKRRADAPPEAVPRSQQRRGDDPPLPAPGRLAKHVAGAALTAIPPSTKPQPSPLVSLPKTRGNGVTDTTGPVAPHIDTSAAVSQSRGKRSSSQKAVVCDPRPRETGKPKIQAPVQRQRKELQQPRGPDCAPQARRRMRPDAIVTAHDPPAAKIAAAKAAPSKVAATAIKMVAAAQNQEAAIKRRPDALFRTPNSPPAATRADKLGSQQQPPADVAASSVEASKQAGRTSRNPAAATKSSNGPKTGNAPCDAQPKALRKSHPHVSSNSRNPGSVAKPGVEQHDRPPLHALKPAKQVVSQPISVQQAGAQQSSAQHGGTQQGDALPIKAELVKAEQAKAQPMKCPPPLKPPRSSVGMQPTRSPTHAAGDITALKSEVPRISGSGSIAGRSQGTVQPPADRRGVQKLVATGSDSGPALARICYLPAGASVTRSFGSVDLRSLEGKQQLLDAFASYSAVASDRRPSELVYQDAEGDWMLLHNEEDWSLVAASATSVLLTTSKVAPL